MRRRAWDHPGKGQPGRGRVGAIVVVGAKQTAAEARVALLAGASGLTGSALLRRLLDTAEFARVIALSRRLLPVEHARLANRILRFEEMEHSLKGLRCSDAFCTLGAAGGPRAAEAELRAVDLALVLAFARTARAAGATRLVVVSAAGADPAAATAFLRTKGEMESALRELGFPSVDVLRPGAVLGARHGDGPGDLLRSGLLRLAAPLLRRSAGALHAMPAGDLAATMRSVARPHPTGFRILSGAALMRAADGARGRS